MRSKLFLSLYFIKVRKTNSSFIYLFIVEKRRKLNSFDWGVVMGG